MEIIPINDYHKVKKNWKKLKKEILLLKEESNLFLVNPDKKRSGITVRKHSYNVEKIIYEVRNGIKKERQDIMSDYS